jgi:AAA15 family ATPase/GTPase
MIISFSIENWMSFRDRVTFSMVASRELQHSDRIGTIAKYKTKVLPIAAIYGGNASGKTNFFKALSFVKKLVVRGTQPDDLIPIEVFRLDGRVAKQPARFTLEMLVDENIYEYSFAVTQKAVIEEKLVLINATSEKVLFDRREGKPNIHKSLAKDQLLQFVFKGTRDNQLFINNSVSQKVDTFRPIYEWFKDVLVLVTPDSRYEFDQFPDEDHPFYKSMSEILPMLDTGIVRLGGEVMPIDNIPIEEVLKLKLREYVKEGMTVRLFEGFIITRKDGELIGKKLNTYHQKSDGTEVQFEVLDESDGTQRIIDLLPAFLELSVPKAKQVYVIDEIDRSLHTLLTWKLLESYLARCTLETRTQLLFTTHDVLLMDQQLLRRDEMWVTEREASGNTKLYSFSEFKDVRTDKDVRKSYLQGRLGGIPNILLQGALKISRPMDENRIDE